MVSAEETEKRPPINIRFEIPYFTVSGIQVRYLKIVEKSGYQALPWVRYITQNGGRTLPNGQEWSCIRTEFNSVWLCRLPNAYAREYQSKQAKQPWLLRFFFPFFFSPHLLSYCFSVFFYFFQLLPAQTDKRKKKDPCGFVIDCFTCWRIYLSCPYFPVFCRCLLTLLLFFKSSVRPYINAGSQP